MKRIILAIETSSDAFAGGHFVEMATVATLLRETAERIEKEGDCDFTILDENGNTVGRIESRIFI